jgi:serine/threonine protein kinase
MGTPLGCSEVGRRRRTTPVYTIREHSVDTLLHRGTASEVWAGARQGPSGFSIPVALKTLNDQCMAAPALVRAFIDEARTASLVQHRNVVLTRDLILDHDRYWIEMELVQGWPIRTLLAAVEASGAQIPTPVALSLVRGAADGLQAIHDAGLVHGDISENNLMLSSAGQLMVLDFGRAGLHDGSTVDTRNDVLNLGAMLDYLLPKRQGAPIALDAIIRRAIDPSSARRFPSARALETALDLVSMREGWLITPSYVGAYLTDMLGPVAPVVPQRRTGTRAAEPAPSTTTTEVSTRAVLPRGRGGMVGVGTTLQLVPEEPAVASVRHVRR